jgi:hypothetical protein
MMASQEIPDIMREITPDYSKGTINNSVSTGPSIYFFLKILLGLIILALLGLNILQYLSDGTDILTSTIKDWGFGLKKQTEKVGKTILPPLKKKKLKKVSNDDIYDDEENISTDLERSLQNKSKKANETRKDYLPKSREVGINPTKKKGYCYLGTDRTYRSCVKVDENDTCMSGKVFPTKKLCINPNLRSF